MYNQNINILISGEKMMYDQKNKNDFNEISKTIAVNISTIMKEKNISQKGLVELSAKKGKKISQATISNIINAAQNCSLDNLVSICNALEITLEELITPNECNKRSTIQDASKNIITNPDNIAFNGYLGKFIVTFYQTIGKNSNLLSGTLQFDRLGDICTAELELDTGDALIKGNTSTPFYKKYTGQLVISSTLNAAYCYLFSEMIGEICFFTFNHFHLFNKSLKCIMADAVTTSAGSNKRATVHRICISDEALSQDVLPYVKGQLLLNDAEILISNKKLDAFKKDDRISPEFVSLVTAAIQNEHYYSITEAKLTGNGILESDLIRMISLLRLYSAAPKYNKISRKTDEALYNLLETKFKSDN